MEDVFREYSRLGVEERKRAYLGVNRVVVRGWERSRRMWCF